MAVASLDATTALIIEAHACHRQRVFPTRGKSGTAPTLLGPLGNGGN